MKTDVAGVYVDAVSKDDALNKIDQFVQSGSAHYIVTTYSEFIVFAENDQEYKNVLNNADLSLPDGMGVIWAANFLAGKKVIAQKISGSKLIWDLAKLASEKNYSMALVGGEDSVAAQSAYVLKLKFPNLKINLALSGKPFDEQTVKEISQSNSDILCIAYQPPKQEKWIAQHLQQLNVKVAIGLGGTFDYLAGRRKPAPDLVANVGLEWLWRLIMQPSRVLRIFNAVIVFPWIVLNYKFNGQN